jgi:hypothetical protein
MTHHRYSDSRVSEEREFYGAAETTEGEHDYFEHIRPPRASLLNTAVTVSAIVLVLSIAFGYHAGSVPVQNGIGTQTTSSSAATRSADSCAEITSYEDRDC